MLFWCIQISIASFILIYLVHHLVNYFKDTLTVPKVKDLVNSPNKKYEDMFAILNNQQSKKPLANDFTEIDLLPSGNRGSSASVGDQFNPLEDLGATNDTAMKSQLKDFLKKQMSSSSEPEPYLPF